MMTRPLAASLVVAALLLGPSAGARILILPDVPPEDGPACTHIQSHDVHVDLGPDAATVRTAITFHRPEAGPVRILLPGTETPDVVLDGEAVALETRAPAVGLAELADLVASHDLPGLIAAAGPSLHTTTVWLPPGAHTLEVVAVAHTSEGAGPLEVRHPMRFLGSACTPPHAGITARIERNTPLGSVFTPFHDLEVVREGRRAADLVLSRPHGHPEADLRLYVSESDDPVAADVLGYRAPGCDGDAPDEHPGYLALTAGPTTDEVAEALPKDLTLVLDVSGSMSGQKIVQARAALQSIIDGLGPRDRFEVVAFSDRVQPVLGGLRDASDADAVATARSRVDALVADGSTDIHAALGAGLAALSEGGDTRPQMLVFLTDGEATSGVTDPDDILAAALAANTRGARLFAFGIGDSVNTYLLDRLGRENGGDTFYIRPGDEIDVALEGFYARIQAPVATDLVMEGRGVHLAGRFPAELPDLYVGTHLLAAARYTDSNQGSIDLSGVFDTDPEPIAVRGHLVRSGTDHAFLPRLWAGRKMAELLFEARENGGAPATVAEIEALARRHGLVTRFTPFLVDADGRVDTGYRNPTDAVSGDEAVGTSSDINAMGRNSNADAYVGPDGAAVMRHVDDRTFIWDRDYFRDTTAPEALDEAETIDVEWGSEDWRRLAAVDARLRNMLAVGRNVVLRWQCQVIRVTHALVDPESGEARTPPAPDRLPRSVLAPAADAVPMAPAAAAPGPAPLQEEGPRGCAATGGAPSSGLLWVLLGLGLGRRRRLL